VQDLCSQHLKKVAVICGTLDLDADQTKALGLWKIKPLVRKGTSLKEAIANAYELVRSRAFELLEENQHEFESDVS
jgi:glycerate kinase